MNRPKKKLVLLVLLLFGITAFAQTDSLDKSKDSLNVAALKAFHEKLAELEQQRISDSLKKTELEERLRLLRTTDNLQKEALQRQLKALEDNEKQRIADKRAKIDAIRNTARGYPVMGVMKDTLFLVYARIGASTPRERAVSITKKIRRLYEDAFLKIDSIRSIKSENTYDIVYGETILMSVSETDALWTNKSMHELADELTILIRNSIIKARKEHSLSKLFIRIALVILVVALAWLIIWLIGKGYTRLKVFIGKKKESWLKGLTYKDYTFMTVEQEMKVILFLVKIFRWLVYALLLYFTLPIIFSIFPFSRDWADALFNLIWSPFKKVLLAVWRYLPNLFSILVIYFVMKYFIRFVRYIFSEIEVEKLRISGFHADWAMPTFSIIRFLLYAFTFVLIFPYLPGSDSEIFKGVSVFLGVLFSLGSSSAIANMIAGLVITYMRPFKIGDRIKLGDTTGDVIEKTLLVTRVKTVKNEVVTIPNSSILTGNTTNYSSEARDQGLILHTTVTIGYNIPWKDVHQALIDAALRTERVLQEPKPFVLQTSLDDFFVSYQINVYTREAGQQSLIYSQLHQNIQDVCNERGIEILSPHYRAARDGNMMAIPQDYLSKDYKAPSFSMKVKKEKEDEE
jgi:small-conductance mechanosensitive channel